MVARRKKLKEQTSAGDAAAEERLSKERKLKVQKRKEKKKQKKSLDSDALGEALALEERKKAKRMKREERKEKKLENAAQSGEDAAANALALEERKKANRIKREERKKRKLATQIGLEAADNASPLKEKKTLENAVQSQGENAKFGVQDAENALALEERKRANRLKREERKKRKTVQVQGEAAGNATKGELEDVSAEKHEDVNADVERDSNDEEKRKKSEKGNVDKGSQMKKNKRNRKVDRWGAPLTEETPEAAGMIEEDNANEKTEEVEYDPKRIYCGGMPYSCTEDEIYNFFAECGAIDEIDYTTFPDTGKFRGLAFITFKTEAGAKNALELNGADMVGRFLTIQKCRVKPAQEKPVYAEAPAKTEGCTSVYIGNLSWDITEKDLRQFFKDCKVKGIRLGRDSETGEFRGYGHVDFEDDESVEKAVKMDQNELLGRPIKIAYAVPPRKSAKEVHRKPRKKTGCFVCGEEGHLSFHCPIKQQT